MVKNSLINKNTYYMLPMELKMIISAYGSNSSKYALNKQDLNNKWYITIIYCNIIFRIPFKALFHTNTKIKGIKGLDFSNATYCTSYMLGYCQIPCKNYCYAYVFEKQYIKSTSTKNGFLKFNSYYKGLLLIRCFKALYSDLKLYNAFIDYIDKKIKVLRFNVNSEFNGINDFKLILDIAKMTNTIVYGYSARDDLLKGYNDIKNNYSNLFINGSNICYDNRYKAVFSLKEYFMASNKCLGSCNDCKKCFKLHNKVITTLFHNSNSDSILNTYDNRLFLIELLNALDTRLNLKETDLKVNKGIYSSLNKFLVSNGFNDLKNLDINNIKELLDYIYYVPRMELNDLEYSNKTILKEYGLI